MDCISLAGNVVLTSTVIEHGRQFACDEEMVTFTCQVIRSASLQWHSPLIRQIVYNIRTTDPVVSMSPFIANLTSIAGSGIFSNFTSTLQVTASRMFARINTTVECRNQQRVNMSSRFTVAGNSGDYCQTFTLQIKRFTISNNIDNKYIISGNKISMLKMYE